MKDEIMCFFLLRLFMRDNMRKRIVCFRKKVFDFNEKRNLTIEEIEKYTQPPAILTKRKSHYDDS